MASYSEVKKFIYKFFGVSDSVSEDSSIAIKINSNIIALENKAFENLFNSVSNWNNHCLELYHDNSRECAIQNSWIFIDEQGDSINAEDEINKIDYLISNDNLYSEAMLVNSESDNPPQADNKRIIPIIKKHSIKLYDIFFI